MSATTVRSCACSTAGSETASINFRAVAVLAVLVAAVLGGCRSTPPAESASFSGEPLGVVVQDDPHIALAWRSLTADEQAKFDLGLAVFNTEWVPANTPAGRIDGLGPLFNSQGCDACHNSRRRGRGPRGEGEAPSDLVIQLGRHLPNGRIQRGIDAYGHVLNTAAVPGFTREASVQIQYDGQVALLADGTRVSLRTPRYSVAALSGPPLPSDTVLMPRMPPTVHGVGLLELVPAPALQALAKQAEHRRGPVKGRLARVEGTSRARAAPLIGRFGWQGTEPTVASQTASAMSREMGLTTTLVPHIDCGNADTLCQAAPSGGNPEVEPTFFDAVVFFEQNHAVPAEQSGVEIPEAENNGKGIFTRIGCAECHLPTLPVITVNGEHHVIHPYTDLLLHDLGSDLADHDVSGKPVHSEWRTAPLWGLHVSVHSGQPLRLLHDGRARTVEEAILWHSEEAAAAREHFVRLAPAERDAVLNWVKQL